VGVSLDYDGLLYGPIYATLGVEAVLIMADGEPPVVLTIKPRLEGIAVGDQVGIETIRPAAFVRRSELADNDLCPADLDGGRLELDGKCWTITAHQPQPSGNGESDGEELLILSELAAGD